MRESVEKIRQNNVISRGSKIRASLESIKHMNEPYIDLKIPLKKADSAFKKYRYEKGSFDFGKMNEKKSNSPSPDFRPKSRAVTVEQDFFYIADKFGEKDSIF